MHLSRFFFLASLSIPLLLGITQSLATSAAPVYLNGLSKRVLYQDVQGNTRFFLSSFTSIYPYSLGTSPYRMAAMYSHAITLLQQQISQHSRSSSFGFHLDLLDLSFRTTTGAPIPWDAALHFMQIMLNSLRRGRIGPEFQAFVTHIGLDVTIEISLRLLLDSRLVVADDGWE